MHAFSPKFAETITWISSNYEEIGQIFFMKLLFEIFEIEAVSDIFDTSDVPNIVDVIDNLDDNGLDQKMSLKII